MRVKLPNRIAVHVHSNGEVSIMKQNKSSYTPEEELVRMSSDEAVGLGLLLVKSGEVLVSHPDKWR